MNALDDYTRRKRRAYLHNPHAGLRAVLDASMFNFIAQPPMPRPGDFTLPPLPEVASAVAKVEASTSTDEVKDESEAVPPGTPGSSMPAFLAAAEKNLFDKTPAKSPRSQLPERESPRSAKKSPSIPIELKARQPSARPAVRHDYAAMASGKSKKN